MVDDYNSELANFVSRSRSGVNYRTRNAASAAPTIVSADRVLSRRRQSDSKNR